jgi:hypothetical protein
VGILKLAVAVENLRFEIGRIRQELQAAPDDGRKLLRLCGYHRQLACGLLLGDRAAAAFEVELFKSARCYLWLLERAPGTVDPYYLCHSRAAPLIDALAAGRPDLAGRIAGLMRSPFSPRMEPEEDYRWFAVLGAAAVPGALRPGHLAAFEATLEGKASARYDLAAALLARDEQALARALGNLAAQWPDEAQARSGGPDGPYFPITEAQVCVEGVAVARLAASIGLRPPRKVRFIPDSVVGPAQASFPDSYAP